MFYIYEMTYTENISLLFSLRNIWHFVRLNVFCLLVLVTLCSSMKTKAQVSETGHPEHFIYGTVISGITSYLVFKKTDNKVKSWFIGFGAAATAGLIKEAIDPSIDGKRSAEDFGYSVLGGAVGASIVIPLKPKKKKEVAYLF